MDFVNQYQFFNFFQIKEIERYTRPELQSRNPIMTTSFRESRFHRDVSCITRIVIKDVKKNLKVTIEISLHYGQRSRNFEKPDFVKHPIFKIN